MPTFIHPPKEVDSLHNTLSSQLWLEDIKDFSFATADLGVDALLYGKKFIINQSHLMRRTISIVASITIIITYLQYFTPFRITDLFEPITAEAAAVPSLSISGTGDQLVGENFSFTVSFDNSSAVDILPDQLEFLSATHNGLPVTPSISGATGAHRLQFTIPSLESGQSGVIQITVRVAAQQAEVITNESIIQSREADPNITNNTSSVDVTVLTQATSPIGNAPRTGGTSFSQTFIHIYMFVYGILALIFLLHQIFYAKKENV